MRKKSICLLTVYMSIGAAVNAVLVLFVGALDISMTEKFITIALTNACIVWVTVDFEQWRENRCSNKRIGEGELGHY